MQTRNSNLPVCFKIYAQSHILFVAMENTSSGAVTLLFDETENPNSTHGYFKQVNAALMAGIMQDYFKYRVVPSFYLVLCFIGLFGNGLVIKVLWSILKRSTMRSVSDILVINLAFADFIFVGSLPFWATELFLQEKWVNILTLQCISCISFLSM